MPLDQFKTQVLLLHSEQSTLDTLSSGFGDRYTVHCATSGVEALTTLGETPINVIISAHKLPGMSGVEALREAKKRSPETIGILLADNNDQSIEALVGEKEVFQVVHGDVTGDGLKKRVDHATQQVRLMALAESANDVTANMEEPAEHIIMETSENGSTIITDGTGRFPALNPEKAAAAAAVGSRSVDVLVLTKDQEFLSTIRESSSVMHTVHYANTLKQADEAIREHKVGVAVVDAAMVGEKVEQLTLHLRKGSPRLVSIVAGRRDDGEMLMELINRGKVYRFLLKPVSPGRARLAVEASIKHHLEAPDAAFKSSGTASPAPRPKPAEKPAAKARPTPVAKPAVERKPEPPPKASPKPESKVAPKPAPRETPKPATKPSPEPVARKAAEVATTQSPVRSDPPLGDAADTPLVEDRFDGAFGDTDTTGGSRFGKPLLIGIGAIAVVAIAGTLFWMMSGEPDAPPQNIVQPPAAATPSITETDLVIDTPAQDTVDTEALVSAALEEVEAALLESRLDEATAALQRVSELDPDNARLPFLTAQLKQIQLRTYLAGARNAIRDSRFEDAANLLAAARALGLGDEAEIDVVSQELRTARSEQRADEVLALAAARLEEGDLLTPVNDNARYYYDLVLSNAPGNATARQGLEAIASKLVLEARVQIDAGNLDAAENLLDDARSINASSGGLAAAASALIAARDAVAERERLAAEARRQEEAERIAAEERAAAERQAAAEAEAEAATQAAVDDAPAETETQGETEPEPAAAEPEQQVVASDGDAATQTVPEQAAQAESRVEPPANELITVPVSSLTRSRYVAPKYPRAAERRGDSGWVDVVFTVTVSGSVKDVEVRDSTPEGVFDRAAIRAVEKWEFEPVFEDGRTVERRVGVRMMFALE